MTRVHLYCLCTLVKQCCYPGSAVAVKSVYEAPYRTVLFQNQKNGLSTGLRVYVIISRVDRKYDRLVKPGGPFCFVKYFFTRPSARLNIKSLTPPPNCLILVVSIGPLCEAEKESGNLICQFKNIVSQGLFKKVPYPFRGKGIVNLYILLKPWVLATFYFPP